MSNRVNLPGTSQKKNKKLQNRCVREQDSKKY